MLAPSECVSTFRMYKHLGVSALTGKRVKGDSNSAIKNITDFVIIHLL